MCDFYYPTSSPAPARLEDFQVFRRTPAPHIYGHYYSTPTYDAYSEPEVHNAGTVYHTLVSSREYDNHDEWKHKDVKVWSENDTVSWIFDVTQSMGLSEYDVPYQNFHVPGSVLMNMEREEVFQRMVHPSMDPSASRDIAEDVYNKLRYRLNEEVQRQPSIIRYADSGPYQHENMTTVLDLDAMNHKNRYPYADYTSTDISLLNHADSSDDAEDPFPLSDTASPECYVSDGSKSSDEDDKKKIFKRPPGRPKGSGRKTPKRPRSVSVPEFLRDLLLNPKFCPAYIKWEDYSLGKFRFVKPDEVAKLWGKLKQNDNMTFEKFSRAMRYHYRQEVLLSVPTARLVYQFGKNGPARHTDNPNFIKLKAELDINNDSVYTNNEIVV